MPEHLLTYTPENTLYTFPRFQRNCLADRLFNSIRASCSTTFGRLNIINQRLQLTKMLLPRNKYPFSHYLLEYRGYWKKGRRGTEAQGGLSAERAKKYVHDMVKERRIVGAEAESHVRTMWDSGCCLQTITLVKENLSFVNSDTRCIHNITNIIYNLTLKRNPSGTLHLLHRAWLGRRFGLIWGGIPLYFL